jgi:anti-sigma regulatory factor (Ser/Thr protein kinase)
MMPLMCTAPEGGSVNPPREEERCMTVVASAMSGNRTVATPAERRPSPEWPAELSSTLVLPAHPTSIRLGRHVVLAWLQFARERYEMDTVLLLVTELLANAVEYSAGPLLLSVSASAERLHVEVKDVSPVDGSLDTTDVARITDERRHLKMVTGLADRWGTELHLTDDEAAARVVWFECGPVAMASGRSA